MAAESGRELSKRFWPSVSRGSEDQCWEWKGPRWPKGYGSFLGRRAHRFAYQLYFGPIPAGMMICHRCDNRACVNPFHMFVGTAKDNARDCRDKGRLRGGYKGPPNSADRVRAIRARYEELGGSTQSVAAEFGVHTETVRRIVRGKRHRRVT